MSDAISPALVGLLGELNDLKRVRMADHPLSLAELGFTRAWHALLAGQPLAEVAQSETAAALVAARLGGIDGAVLAVAGLDERATLAVRSRALDAVAATLAAPFRAALASTLERYPAAGPPPPSPPAWVQRLMDQPRAGATCPGRPRLVLEPPESHGDHCYTTAIYGVLIAAAWEAPVELPFLAGLCHHFHNVYLPDAGFTGEALLGDHLETVVARLSERTVAALPPVLQGPVAEARTLLTHADTPVARAFHAADVIDRVLQMQHYARGAQFQLAQALDDMELVHPGPLQRFQQQMLAAAGLWP
ncbi:MAG: hypothetical protein ACFCBW_12050 [Candidatus Competibacterales bacterium]